jgi:hypothetical protein
MGRSENETTEATDNAEKEADCPGGDRQQCARGGHAHRPGTDGDVRLGPCSHGRQLYRYRDPVSCGWTSADPITIAFPTAIGLWATATPSSLTVSLSYAITLPRRAAVR